MVTVRKCRSEDEGIWVELNREFMAYEYEEALDEDVMARAVHYIRQADVLLIGGTSLVVYPAAGLVRYYRGHKLVVINKGTVGADIGADLVIDGPIGQVLAQV